MPLSAERKTWYFERLKELLDNHTKIFLVQVKFLGSRGFVVVVPHVALF